MPLHVVKCFDRHNVDPLNESWVWMPRNFIVDFSDTN